MRRAIFILVSAGVFGCSTSTTTGGAQGRADFSFSASEMVPANKPIALGSDVTLCVRIHDTSSGQSATFDSQSPDVVRITGASSTSVVGDWFVVVRAANEGTSRIAVGDGMGKIIDTFDLTVSAIAKLDIPSSADVSVAHNRAIDVTARNAKGDEVYAPNAIAWTVDRPDVVQFWDSLRNTAQPATTGTSLDIRGIAVGTATLRGSYGKTMLAVPITVK